MADTWMDGWMEGLPPSGPLRTFPSDLLLPHTQNIIIQFVMIASGWSSMLLLELVLVRYDIVLPECPAVVVGVHINVQG